MDPLLVEVDQLLSRGDKEPLETVLDRILERFDCAVGTVHELNRSDGLLHLRAHRGLPEVLLDRVSKIPIGKGMAGLAAQRREPVQVCNLQTDDSGAARPGAKQTQMEGSIALPMLCGDVLYGSLGVAKPVPYEFTPEETETLLALASRIGESFR